MIFDTALIAYDLLSRDDIADLRATRDADELADYLITNAPINTHFTTIKNDFPFALDPMIESLRPILVAMILNPID